MGKYERSLKQVQLKNMVEEGDYDSALDIVETLVNDRSADASDLKLYAEVYNKCGMFDRARDLYRRVYKEIPTRRVLYRLIVMCAKSGDIDEAEELLETYIEKGSSGIDRYVLRYRIDKEAGDSYDVLIRDLEAIVDTEYSEKWAYELIKTYYYAGMNEECIAECRNMIMWFSEGEYVNKARKLLNHFDVDDLSSAQPVYREQEEVPEAPVEEEGPEAPVMEEVPIAPVIEEEPIVPVIEEEPVEEEPPAAQVEEETQEEPVAEETPAEPAEEEIPEASVEEEAPTEDIIAKVEIPDDLIAPDIFPEEEKEPEKKEEEASQKEFSFSKFADDIPYIYDKLFFSSIDNINVNRLSFVVAATDKKAADHTVQKIAKIVRKVRGQDIRIAKISALKLNSIDFEKELKKLDGACILVDNAAEMSAKSINSVIKVIEVYSDRVSIILMDSEEALSRMFFREQILKNQIAHFIYVN